MKIKAEEIGKRFNKDWIFKNLNLTIETGEKLAIVGNNGAGKSTLLKVLGGYSIPTKGKVKYFYNNDEIDDDEIQLKMNFTAPYFNLIEEFTLSELMDFHGKFKNATQNIDLMLQDCDLHQSRDKFIKDFSSGMKQRVKLVLAFGYEADIILLDEPSSNLDEIGIKWFEKQVNEKAEKTSIVIASNLSSEIQLCDNEVLLNKFKK